MAISENGTPMYMPVAPAYGGGGFGGFGGDGGWAWILLLLLAFGGGWGGGGFGMDGDYAAMLVASSTLLCMGTLLFWMELTTRLFV